MECHPGAGASYRRRALPEAGACHRRRALPEAGACHRRRALAEPGQCQEIQRKALSLLLKLRPPASGVEKMSCAWSHCQWDANEMRVCARVCVCVGVSLRI